MFERFTIGARQVVVLAQEEARALRHHYVGPEHLLLGLLEVPEGLGGRVLRSLGLTAPVIRDQIAFFVGAGEEASVGQIPITPRAKAVLDAAREQALGLGLNVVGTEHLLLGLVADQESIAARLLRDHGNEPAQVRREVLLAISTGIEEPQSGGPVVADTENVDEPPRPADDRSLGWRSRPIALAGLGAAVLSRLVFAASRTNGLHPLQMQVLVRLVVGAEDEARSEDGELVESLAGGLRCDLDDLGDAIATLRDQRLIVTSVEQDDDERVSITPAGVRQVDDWLARCAPVFGGWPPDFASADDATN